MPITAVCKRCNRQRKQVKTTQEAKRYYCYACKQILKEEARIVNAQDI